MTKLTQKSVKFNWGEKKETAFQTLKKKLCSASILALPKGSENFIVYCDASHKGLGAVLMQRINVETLLYGKRSACSTDHKSLQHIPMIEKKLNMRQCSMVRSCLMTTTVICVSPGKVIVVADA
ncbi:putative reverse transcriptase domain-containing protein [Tanacetum coccineum]